MRAEYALELTLTEFDPDPSGSELYVSLDVEAKAGAFSGASFCIVARRDFAHFLDRLETLATTGVGEALLVGGWVSTEDVRFRAFSVGSRGLLGLQVVLGEVPEHEHRSQFEAFFESEPQPILRLVSSLRAALAERKTDGFSVFVRAWSAT